MNKIITILLIAVGFLSVNASAAISEPVVATIDQNMMITLPANQPLNSTYVIDITGLNFTSDAVLQNFCASFGDRSLALKGNFDEKKIVVELTPFKDSTGATWDVARWNQYFGQRAPKMQAYMQSMNK